MWRLTGRGLGDVPRLLQPGETVLATAPGEGQIPKFTGLTLATGIVFEQGFLLVATDRRLLALGLTMSAGNVATVHQFPYAQITNWRAGYSRAATLVTKTGVVEVAAGPDEAAGVKRIPGDRFEAVRAAVEARLPPSVDRA